MIDTGPTPHGMSRVRAAIHCPQLYAWTFLRGVPLVGLDNASELPTPGDAPQPAPALLRGIVTHVMAAHFYARMRGDAVEPHFDAMEETFAKFERLWPDSTTPFRRAVRAAAHAFVDEYASDADRFDILEVEQAHAYTISVTGRDGVTRSAPFTMRRDLVLRAKATGLVYYVDHKSTFRIESKVKDRYILSGQFLSLQHVGVIEHGPQFGGVLYNLIQVGQSEPGFLRERVAPAPFRLQRWPRDYLYAKRLVSALEASYGQDPCDWPGADSETACFTAYGPCAYMQHCRWGPGYVGQPAPTP